MNVSLTPELERRIAEKLETGLYSTASELIREALRRLFDVDEDRRRFRDRFEAEVAEAIAQLDRGEGIPGEQVFEDLDRLIESKRQRG